MSNYAAGYIDLKAWVKVRLSALSELFPHKRTSRSHEAPQSE
jgi:hypothetical protein